MANHLHIDPFSGIAGDMFIGALLDLGLSLEKLEQALAPLAVKPGYDLSAQRVMRCGVSACDFQVNIHKTDGKVGHCHYPHIVKLIDQLDAPDLAKKRARNIVDRLARAEAKVHGIEVDRVHFHEVGAVDSIVDMLGAAVGVTLLDIQTISCGPMPLSHGYAACQHGTMPVPAPATAYLLQGLPTIGMDQRMELVTPTGAAIAAALSDRFGPSPVMTLRGVGYGAGDKDLPNLPNALRLMLGQTAD